MVKKAAKTTEKTVVYICPKCGKLGQVCKTCSIEAGPVVFGISEAKVKKIPAEVLALLANALFVQKRLEAEKAGLEKRIVKTSQKAKVWKKRCLDK